MRPRRAFWRAVARGDGGRSSHLPARGLRVLRGAAARRAGASPSSVPARCRRVFGRMISRGFGRRLRGFRARSSDAASIGCRVAGRREAISKRFDAIPGRFDLTVGRFDLIAARFDMIAGCLARPVPVAGCSAEAFGTSRKFAAAAGGPSTSRFRGGALRTVFFPPPCRFSKARRWSRRVFGRQSPQPPLRLGLGFGAPVAATRLRSQSTGNAGLSRNTRQNGAKYVRKAVATSTPGT